MRRAVMIAALTLPACAPEPTRPQPAAITACGEVELTGELVESECQITAAGQMLHVKFAPLATGTVAGNVSIDVMGDDGAVAQTMIESDVSEYRAPHVQDVDGDGRADILIPRETGNVNTVTGVWIFNGERGRYERVGAVSGVSIERTEEGLIAVPARSGAAAWNVAFYRLDEGGLVPLATVDIEAEDVSADGVVARSTCELADAPGLGDLNMSEEAAEAKFCAEPVAAGVFGP